MSLQLALGLGLGAHRKVGAKDPGELPAVFTVTAGDGTKYVRVRVSEATTVTPAGGTSIRIGSSGEFVTTQLTLAANTNQDIYFKDAGSFTIYQRKLVIYLWISGLGSSFITSDITGMKLDYLYLFDIGSSSVITGKITGVYLRGMYINSVGLSLAYGVSSLNISTTTGIQLVSRKVFATAAEYARLIHDAANATWGGKYPFRIDEGTNENCPDWDTVKADVAVLLNKAAWTIIPSAWLSANGGTWPADWYEYEG